MKIRLSCSHLSRVALLAASISTASCALLELSDKFKEVGVPIVPTPNELAQIKGAAARTAASTVVLAYRDGFEQGITSCGGVVVAKGIAATAAHCVEAELDHKKPEKRRGVFDDQFRLLSENLDVLVFDKDLDVAMLKIDENAAISPATWTAHSHQGQTAYIQGHLRPAPGGTTRYLATPVTVIEETPVDVLIKGDALHGGFSGSPIFDLDGSLVAIMAGLRTTVYLSSDKSHWRSAARASAMEGLLRQAQEKLKLVEH